MLTSMDETQRDRMVGAMEDMTTRHRVMGDRSFVTQGELIAFRDAAEAERVWAVAELEGEPAHGPLALYIVFMDDLATNLDALVNAAGGRVPGAPFLPGPDEPQSTIAAVIVTGFPMLADHLVALLTP